MMIATPRLILRTVTLDDVDPFAASWNLDGEPISPQEAAAKITAQMKTHTQNQSDKFEHLCLAIVEKETQEFIGWCGIDHTNPQWRCPVMFYMLKKEFWGKGLATEAANALIDYGFRTIGFARIDSGADYSNIASKRVMEKIGMRYLGLDEQGGHFFTLTRKEYLRR